MDDHRDDLDTWLNRRVDPLAPPSGTFDLIKRRARRRKYRKLAITAGAAVVIAAAAVAVPQVISLPVLSPSPTSSAAAHGQSSTPTPTGGGNTSTSSVLPASAPAPVPPDFQPTSVTFIGLDTGWAIGQAGTPGHCATQYCTSVARTGDGGKTWNGGPAPVTGAPDGATGVSQIRFLNDDDGWAFGPQLYATHDGGRTWTAVDTGGLRVIDLETVSGRAFALFASCSGGGTAFAAGCTSFTLYSSPASADSWAPVGASTSGLTASGQDGAASIVLAGTVGYLLAPDGILYAGPVDGSAAWRPVSDVPCAVGTAQADGQPAGALLAAATATNLDLACTPPPVPGGPQKKLIFTSTDGGSSWQQTSAAPAAGVATSLAASPAGTAVLATNQGMDLLPAGSTSWQQVTLTGPPAGGFSFVGMTSDEQGVAVPANPAAGTVWFSYDGGQSWKPSSISGS